MRPSDYDRVLSSLTAESVHQISQYTIQFLYSYVRAVLLKKGNSPESVEEALGQALSDCGRMRDYPSSLLQKDSPAVYVKAIAIHAHARLGAKITRQRGVRDELTEQAERKRANRRYDGRTPVDGFFRNIIVRRAVKKLPEKKRRAIELYYLNPKGYTQREVAVIMDISVETVRDHLKIGLKKLNVILGPDKDELL